jgi:hypothetical protein
LVVNAERNTSMRDRGWQEVASFAAAGGLRAVAEAVDAPGARVRRFEAGAGERALLVPVEALDAGEVTSAVSDILFVHPPTAATALSLAAEVGDLPRSVWVALPPGADPAGLVADVGTVTVGSPEPVRYALFRPADRRSPAWEAPPGAGRMGEDEGALEARQRWFEAREGGD